MIELREPQKRHVFNAGYYFEDLLKPIFKNGQKVYSTPKIEAIQQHAKTELNYLPEAIRRIVKPQPYPNGLEENLHQLKLDLIQRSK